VDWEEITLGNVIYINRKNISKNNDFSYINYYDISSIGTGLKKEFKYYKIEDMPSRAKRLIDDKDIIISTVRPIHRAFYYCENTKYNDVVSTGFAVLTANEKFIDSRFLYYIISSDDFTNYLVSNEQGATYPAVTPDIIKKAKVKLPPLKTQKKIASILSNYDKLIENNNQRIKLLESMAEEIYKEWFVRLRFPEIKGLKWESKKLGDISNFFNGKSIKKSSVGDYPIFGANGTIGRSDKYQYENIIIVGRVGVYCGSIFHVKERCWATDNTIILKPNSDDILFIKYFLQFKNLNNYAGGSAQPLLTQTQIKFLLIDYPSKELLDKFNQLVVPMDNEIENLQQKNKNLKETRDLLLPKLIHGTLKI